jgi:hypothetical protein
MMEMESRFNQPDRNTIDASLVQRSKENAKNRGGCYFLSRERFILISGCPLEARPSNPGCGVASPDA